ncbi:MAG: aminotransferase class I/II-fold pyridoxal phosphate-dependent enzyme, partial [bacterium]|nr:aminotransferase class I/II-fold pyridoxal phosphate-dependent enzyme [bacterium]
MIEGHGDDLFRFEGRVRINFSSNIPQNVNHEELIRHLCERGSLVGNYPEPEPKSVERRLAQLLGLEPESVIVTNGATEAIYLIAHLFEGKRSAIVAPTFREYQDAAKVFAHRVSFISSIDEIEASDADIVWLCNPNNPTGEVFCRERLLSIIDRCREKVFVIDQAYALYSVKRVLSAEDIAGRDNVVILHSLTKEYMIPGLRIGYAIGSAGVMDALRGLRMPWSVNA